MPPKHLCSLSSSSKLWSKSSALIPNGTERAEGLRTRIWAMLILFSVSLFASSFPALSKRISYLRIPRVVFFLGKHFGTGVILSTAFVHLLQDAFTNLAHPLVKERWNVGNWTGLIVLGSLLSIFLVEYISTAYVDRLQSYSSPSPTPPTSSNTSRTPSVIQLHQTEVEDVQGHNESTPLMHGAVAEGNSSMYGSTEDVELLMEPEDDHHLHHSTTAISSLPKEDDEFFSGGHHRHETRSAHASHTVRPSRRESLITFAREVEEEAITKSHIAEDHDGVRGSHAHECNHEHGSGHAHIHVDMDEWDPDGGDHHRQEIDDVEVKVGHRRQVVGILMLQMGIMIHSLVIGLTLAITSGSEFTSLITAIIFHQLFEGLSLGIRIAALPSGRILKPTLAFTFAVTTPVGIALGLVLFGGSRSAGAKMILIQGLMSAISAGMLIYAACVEMLAGDFVMDPLLWRSSVGKQILALVSMFVGAGAMALIGWD